MVSANPGAVQVRQVGISEELLAGSYEDAVKSLQSVAR